MLRHGLYKLHGRAVCCAVRQVCGAVLQACHALLPICLSISLSIRVQVGEGKAVFDAAVKAVKAWQHLQLGETLLLLPLPALGAAPPGARLPYSSPNPLLSAALCYRL